MNDKIQIYITIECPECKGSGKGKDQWHIPELEAILNHEWLCSKCFGNGTIKVKPE